MATWPLANRVTNAFRSPFFNSFSRPSFKIWAAAAPVLVFGWVRNAIMSCMGPFDVITAETAAPFWVVTLGAPLFWSFSPLSSTRA